jgi:KipI family sensor histidine kinase inhibitor
MLDVDFRPCGDGAVLAVLGNEIDEATVRRVWSLARALRHSSQTGLLDIVPAYVSVLIRFDPFVTDLARVISTARGAAERAADLPARYGRRFTIAVCFGREHGVDFERAAHELGMRENRMRELFCRSDYRVAFLGFLAGFPYLLGLPHALSLPRLDAPRPRVPAGSVAVAAGQCGIYPRQSPGGWWLFGRTMAPLFDPLREPPALLMPGDAVRFIAADALEDTRAVDLETVK